jgi:hypothetical protein
MIAHTCEYASRHNTPQLSLVDMRGFFDICAQNIVKYKAQSCNIDSIAVSTALVGYVFPALLTVQQTELLDAKVRTVITQLAKSPFLLKDYGARRSIDSTTQQYYLPATTQSALCQTAGYKFEQKNQYVSHLIQTKDRVLQKLHSRYTRSDHFTYTALHRFAFPLFGLYTDELQTNHLSYLDAQYGEFIHPFPACFSHTIDSQTAEKLGGAVNVRPASSF